MVYRLAHDGLDAQFGMIVEKAMEAIRAAEPKPDAVFGAFNPLRSMLQSSTFHEGRLLEGGLLAIARCNPDLTVLPQNRRLPIVQAAIDVVDGNEPSSLEGIRLNARTHAVDWYMPDLLIAHRPTQSLLIADVKRSVASTEDRRLVALLRRMTAAGLTAADWVYSEYRGMLIREVRIAIIDGSNETGNATDGVFPLSALDDLLHTEGAGEAMERLRAIFARTVQEELEAQCRALVRQLGQNAASRDGGHGLAASVLNGGDARDPGEDHQRYGGSAAALTADDARGARGASERDAIGGPDPDLSPLRIPVVKVGLARPAIH